MRIYCNHAQEFEQGDPCPYTGQDDCLNPICPLIETGDATVSDESEEDD